MTRGKGRSGRMAKKSGKDGSNRVALHTRRVGLRWGRILMALEVGKRALDFVHSERHGLPEEYRQEVEALRAKLSGLEMKLWSAEATLEVRR